MGGKARARALSAQRRREISAKANTKRWHGNEFVEVEKKLTRKFDNRGDFMAWIRRADHGEVAIYFVGELAHFRQEAPLRLRELESLADAAKPSKPRPPGEAIEMENLRNQLELAQSVSLLAESKLLHLTQKRRPEGGSFYIATRTRLK